MDRRDVTGVASFLEALTDRLQNAIRTAKGRRRRDCYNRFVLDAGRCFSEGYELAH
jgi:hypothetical protein